jgi:hypothetical protein
VHGNGNTDLVITTSGAFAQAPNASQAEKSAKPTVYTNVTQAALNAWANETLNFYRKPYEDPLPPGRIAHGNGC